MASSVVMVLVQGGWTPYYHVGQLRVILTQTMPRSLGVESWDIRGHFGAF